MASNLYPLPTPVYRLPTQSADHKENIESSKEPSIADAETVAKSFAQVLHKFCHSLLLFISCISNSQWNASNIWFILFNILDAVLCLIVSDISKTASDIKGDI